MTSSGGRRTRTTRPPVEQEQTLRIDRIGADGDGVAVGLGNAILHVEGALPGETVIAESLGRQFRATHIATASTTRVVPPCILAEACGGCALQHWARDATLAWKSGRVEGALQAAGYATPAMRRPIQAESRTRRRMVLAMSQEPSGRAVAGLRRRSSHEVIDMVECHVLHPGLFGLLAPLRELLAGSTLLAAGETGVLTANLLDNGPDLLLRTRRAPDPTTRAALARFAAATGVARISWQQDDRADPEPIVMLARPTIMFGDRTVEPAPGAFLQAVATAEQTIVDDVVAAAAAARVSRKAGIVELYAGNGTLTFPLAAVGPVRAYEGDPHAVRTLARASGGTRVTAIARDLSRAPVTSAEFKAASIVVLDPPHDGAGRQIDEIAAARVPSVVLVSCNPAALGREARVLNHAGYALEGARAIDQFLFSARVESVSVFRRA